MRKRVSILLLSLLCYQALLSQKVGIGTSNPQSTLDVIGSETTVHGTNAAISLTNTAWGLPWYFRAGASGTATPPGSLSIANDGGYHLIIDQYGQVGIGETSPHSPLTFASGTYGNKIAFYGPGNSHFGIGVDASLLKIYSPDVNSDIGFGWQSNLIFSEKMRIKGSGNVGIGTSTPNGILHLKGTNWIKTVFENNSGETRGYIGSDGNGTITLSSNAYWNGSAWVYPNPGPSMYMLLHQTNQQFEFRVRPDAGSQNTAMVIDINGRVGIGNTSPTVPLQFGSTSGNKIALSQSGGNYYGMGTQTSLLQFYTPTASDDIAFGYGNSNSFTENIRMDGSGSLAVKTNLTVQNGKGIIRSSDGTQQKKLTTTVTINTTFLAGETKTFPITWPETFSGSPDAFVGNMIFGASGWAEILLTIISTSPTGGSVSAYNPKSVSVTPNYTMKIIAIGPQ